MLQAEIKFREIERTDYPALEKIICDTWNYERLCTRKTALALAKVYLASCLAAQTYTCVAVKDGEAVGIIMAKDIRCPVKWRYKAKQFADIAAMLLIQEGRKVLKIFEGFDDINKVLLAQCGYSFGGEIAFFVLRSDIRGGGVGKELLARGKAYLQAQGVNSFYLFTDTTCNYGFYEHQGLRRIGENTHTVAAFKDKEMSSYIYAYGV